MKDAQQTTNSLIDEFNDNALYDIATSILYHLQGKGYCIWQTYTKDDIKLNTGKKTISRARMDELQDRLENTFANDYLT